MSEGKTFNVSYRMVDGEVFKWTYGSRTRKDIVKVIYKELEQTCFHLGQIPTLILVSANVISVDIIEKL